MAGVPWRLPLGALLHRLWDCPSETFFRFLFEERTQWVGQATPCPAERPPPRREVRAAPRERMAARAHEVDEVFLKERSFALHGRKRRGGNRFVRPDGKW